MEKTICELFAGVGGLRLGFERNSDEWKTVWFSQWEPDAARQWAHDCYVQHFGDIDDNTGIDIAEVDKTKIPNHSLLVGGFPCQDYSVAHGLINNEGIEGKKGVLWWQIREILIKKNSPFVLLENVDRLLKSPAKQRGRDFGIMLACFAELGYCVEWRVINAAEYGAAQRRRRIFIFAYKNTTAYHQKMKKYESSDILFEAGFMVKAFPLSGYSIIKQTKLNYSNIQSISDTFQYDFENTGFMRDGIISTVNVTSAEEKPIPLRALLEKNVEDSFYVEDTIDKWTYLKGAKKINRQAKSGFNYIFSEGPIAFPDKLDLPARTMLTSEGTVNRSTHVIKDPQTNRLRLITPLEAERIQGFDDNWTNTGMTLRMRYFCMGNALVVPMITRMAEVLYEIIDNE